MLTKKKGTMALLLILLLILMVRPVYGSQEHITEVVEANPPNTVLKEGPVVRTKKPVPAPEPLPPPVAKKKVALTFDDGPDLRYTPQLLEILRTEQVPATFFVLGEKVEWYPEMLKRIFTDGHLIANHSRTHVDFELLSNEEIIRLELDPTSRAVEKLTGYYPLIMRPPYGSLRVDSVQFLNAEGWKIVRWSLDTFDWDPSRNKPAQIIDRILRLHHPNAIVLMHCNNKSTVDVLPELIRTLRSLGYDFVTVTQLD